LLLGCSSEGVLLIGLEEVSPRSIGVGDRLRITGTGYPEDPPAVVRFAGSGHRAGEPVLRGLEVEAEARTVGPSTLEVPVTPELVRAFTGDADARRTTFRGDLEVSFRAPKRAGASVVGRRSGIVLDVTPEETPHTTVQVLRREGRRFAAFLGTEIVRDDGGLRLGQVEAGGRAARAGLREGDRVLELEGLVVADVEDFVPPPNARRSLVVVQRGAEPLPVRVDSAGFRFTSPKALEPAAALVGAALAAFALLCSPLARAFSFFERRLIERLSGARRAEARAELGRVLLQGLARELPTSFSCSLAVLAATCALVLLSFGRSLLAPEVDLVALPLSTLAALITTTLAVGGGGARWSLREAVKRIGAVLLQQVPFGIVLFLAAMTTGSLSARTLVAAQGPWPWQWHLAAQPGFAIAGMAALGALVPIARPARAFTGARPVTRRERAVELAAFTHHLAVATVLVVIVFGGWGVPPGGTLALQLLGAAAAVGKVWVLLVGVAMVRWVLGAMDVVRLQRTALVWLCLPSVAGAALSLTMGNTELGAVFLGIAEGFGPALVLFAALGVGLMTRRAIATLGSRPAELGVHAWL